MSECIDPNCRIDVERIPVVPAADYDALERKWQKAAMDLAVVEAAHDVFAKRVEELEEALRSNRADNAEIKRELPGLRDDILGLMAERDRALAVVEAVRDLDTLDMGDYLTVTEKSFYALRDALAAYDKEGK